MLFGILVIMMMEIGVLTPPLGTNIFAVKAAAGEDLKLGEIFAGAAPFSVGYLVAVILIILFPAIALWLPNMMH